MSFQTRAETRAETSRTSAAAVVFAMLSTCWLATAAAHPNGGPMAEPTIVLAEWQDEESELPPFIVQIVDQSGQPVPGATIESKRDQGEVETLIASEAGILVLKRGFSVNCVLVAKKLDKNQQAVEIGFLHLSGFRVRGKQEQKHNLDLKPAGRFRFTVKDDSGNVVEGAKVFGRYLNNVFDFAIKSTDRDGVAEIDLPLNTKLEAWVKSPRGIALKRFEAENLASNREIEVNLGPVRKTQLVVLDQDDQPASGVSVSLNFQTADGSYFNGTYQKTNEFGIIEISWMPKDPEIFFRPFAFTKDRYQMDQRRTMSASIGNPGRVVVYVNKLAERVCVFGKVKGAIAGTRLEVIAVNLQSISPSKKRRFHDFKSTETENGEFELNLVPGVSYSISATNDQWASSYGPFLMQEKSDQPQLVELELKPTALVMVSLTTGADRLPLSNAQVSYRKTQTKFPDMPDGNYFQTVILRSKPSDGNGEVSFGAAFGEGEIAVSHAGWSESRKIVVREGKTTHVEFSAPMLGSRIIKGQVEVPGNARNKFRCEVRMFNVAGPGERTTKTDKDGNWSMEIDWSNASLIAYSADRKYGGIAFAKELESDAPLIKLRPTVKVSGQLTDDVGKPVPNVTLVQYHETQSLIGESSRLPYHGIQTQIDGSFEFDGVITNITQKLAVQTSPGGYSFVGGDATYQAGQDVENVMAVFRDSERAARRKAIEAIEESKDEKEQVEPSKQKTPQ